MRLLKGLSFKLSWRTCRDRLVFLFAPTREMAYLALLCFAGIVFFTNWRPEASLHQHHFSNTIYSFQVCLPYFGYSCDIFKIFHYYCICYSDLWCLHNNCLGYHKPPSYKTVNLMDKWCMCLDSSMDQLFLHLSLSLRPPYSLRHSSIEVRPVNNLTMASKCPSGRMSYMPLRVIRIISVS